jgi:NHLM bacteriocin system ABC transporter ATP-binding protein
MTEASSQALTHDAVDDDDGGSFLINARQDVWIVLDGAVDIFAVPLRGGEIAGTRRHLYRAGPGDALFGLAREEKSDGLGLLAVETTDTILQKLSTRHWQALLNNPDLQENFADWIDGWIQGLCVGLTPDRPPKQARGLAPREDLMFKERGYAFAPGEVLWVGNLEGRISWLEQDIPAGTGPDSLFPVAPSTWLEAHGDARLHCFGNTAQLPPKQIYAALERFHAWLMNALQAAGNQARSAERERLRRKAEHEQRLMEGALQQMAAILTAQPDELSPQDKTGIPLIDACRLVLHASGIALRLPAKLQSGLEPLVLLENVARASRFNMRQVALTRADWWRMDHGPLLAFMKDGGRPVALLPNSGGGYRLADPEQTASRQVDAEIAALLGDTALMFFRSFPAQAMGLGALLRFGLAGTSRDLVRLVSLGLLGSILGVFVPYATGLLIDFVIPGAERGRLLQIALILATAAFASGAFEFVRSLALLRIEGKMGLATHAAIIDRLLYLPTAFFREYSAGDLAQRAFGIDSILQLMAGATQIAILQGVFSLASFAYLFAIDLRLAATATALALIALILTTALNLLRLNYERRRFKLEGDIASRVFQLLTGITKLRMSGAESRAFATWAKDFAAKKQFAFKTQRLANHLAVFEAAYPVLASLVIFALIAVYQLNISTGDFLAFNAAFTQFLMATLGLSTALTASLNAIPLYERAKPILETLPEVDEAKAAPGELHGDIELSRIAFRYNADGPPILKDIDVRIKPGEFVAFVGPSGSGKSTLFRLLLGFEQPESGAVYYDGQDLAGLDVRAVRRQLGVVLQNGKLMPGDIFTNIIGSAPLTLDDAWEAARLAGLEEDIRAMPMGMHTVIGEGMGTFSGGQKQRLMIARALVGKPRILLFDEATSALDNRTQATVSQSLERLNATRVVIAHRLSTVLKADRIYVIEGGRIVESGTYDDLMSRSGRFAELARRQLV